MKAPSTKVRFSEAQKLLDYGFNNFEYYKFCTKDQFLKEINVIKSITPTVKCVYENTCGTLLEKGKKSSVEQVINIPESISAPIEKGQKIGEISYTLNGENLGTVNIISDENIFKIGLSRTLEKLFFSWFRVLR